VDGLQALEGIAVEVALGEALVDTSVEEALEEAPEGTEVVEAQVDGPQSLEDTAVEEVLAEEVDLSGYKENWMFKEEFDSTV